MERPSVALFAYNIRPRSGSDPGLGWQWADLAGRFCDVTVFTRSSNRQWIESSPAPDGVQFEYVDLSEREGRLGIGNPWYDAFHCYRWIPRAVERACELHEHSPFDLSHFATFSAFWMPGPFHRLGVPHLGGVFTGGESTHPGFTARQSGRARAKDALRNVLIELATRHPDWRRTYTSPATLSVVESQPLRDRMLSAGAGRVTAFRPPMSMSDDLRSELEAIRSGTRKSDAPSLVASGRQVHWKGFRWAIDALGGVRRRHREATLTLFGDGPDHEALKRYVGADPAITFVRAFSLEEERRAIAAATAFVFPNERDGGAAVLQFAMALGTPIVGFPVGAAPAVTGDGVATWVEPTDGDNPGDALGHSISRVLSDSALRSAASDAGLRRVSEDLSEASALDALTSWYEELLGQPPGASGGHPA